MFIKSGERNEGGFDKFYHFLFKPEYDSLSMTDKAVYCRLRNFLNLSEKNKKIDKVGNHYVEFTQKIVAEGLRISEKTVLRAMPKLKEVGLIEIVEQGTNKTNWIYFYELKTEEQSETKSQSVQLGDKMSGSVGDKMSGSSVTKCHLRKQAKKEINKKENTINKLIVEEQSPSHVQKTNSNSDELKDNEGYSEKAQKNGVAMIEKVKGAISGKVAWGDIKPTHLAFYYRERHFNVFNTDIPESMDRSVSSFKDNFLDAYVLDGKQAVRVIDKLLPLIKNGNPEGIIVDFEILGDYHCMNEYISTVLDEIEEEDAVPTAIEKDTAVQSSNKKVSGDYFF